MKKYAEGAMKGILEYCEDDIVSSDIIHNPASSVFDSKCTLTLKKDLKCIKIVSWYDNEWGYSNRVCDLCKLIATKGFLK
jgi:glyceraldehyde 3-phosphate dehydrogenase